MSTTTRSLKKRSIIFFIILLCAGIAIVTISLGEYDAPTPDEISEQDAPIPGGILAYRADTIEGKKSTSCACGHDGYFLLSDEMLLWYVTDHEKVQSMGTITSQTDNIYTVKKEYSTGDADSVIVNMRIEKRDKHLHIDTDTSQNDPEDKFILKQTYLGPNVKELVDSFMREEKQRASELTEPQNSVVP